MLKNDYADQNCSIAKALEVVGERWTLLIVRQLLRQPSRFLVLQKQLNIAKNVLASRLDKLVSVGIVEKVEVERARDWNVYKLTRKGYDLFPVINALMTWGDAHAAPNGPPVVVHHRCGHAAGHRLVCEGCGETVDRRNVHLRPGPGWIDDAEPAERLERAAADV